MIKVISLIGVCLLLLPFKPMRANDVEFPLVQAITYFPFQSHHLLGKSQFTLTLDVYYSNIYMFDNDIPTVNDLELCSVTANIRYGILDRLTLEIFMRFAYFFGGVLDPLIEWVHEMTGWSVSGRDQFPRNTLHYEYDRVFTYKKSQLYLSHPLVAVVGRIYQTRNWEITTRFGLGLPLMSRRGLVSPHPFFTLGVITAYRFGEWHLEWINHWSIFSPPDWFSSEEMAGGIWQAEFRARYKIFLAGLVRRTSPFSNGDLRNTALQVILGLQITPKLELLFVEDIPPMDTVPDISFHLRYQIR